MKRIRMLICAAVCAAVLGVGTAAFWHWIEQPYILRTDIRGKGMDVEQVKKQEEKEKDGAGGILRIAGWRIEKEQYVFSESTGRKDSAQVIGVYGDMELVEDLHLRCGRFGLAVEGDYCVLSEKLARELFGNADIVGEQIGIGKEKFFVVGVAEKEENVVWIAVCEGELEMMALEIDGRLREKVNRAEWLE